MEKAEKIALIKDLIGKKNREHVYYDLVDQLNEKRWAYSDFMITEPINCDEELKRLPKADYDLTVALLTMLLREDHFSNGSFERRLEKGQIDEILKHLLEVIE